MTPIVINNFNRLTTTKKLVEDLIQLGEKEIYILDNKSTYRPLLEWYEELEGVVQVKRLEKNMGQNALWESNSIEHFQHCSHIVYTDPDIQLSPGLPKKFIDDMIWVAESLHVNKIGLALEIDDLPDNELCNLIRSIESRYWKSPLKIKHYEVYNAPVDTTFALIKPTMPFTYDAVRIAGDFTCKHMPWYLDWNDLDEEEKFILDTADPVISTYKAHYLRWKENH